MTLVSALLWPASSFNPGHQTHSNAGPGAGALHCGENLHPRLARLPKHISALHFQWFPVTSRTLSWAPWPLMGFPPMTCGEQGRLNGSIVQGDRGIPPWAGARGNHSETRWSTSWSAFHRSSSVCWLKGSRFTLTVPVKRTGSWGWDGYRKRRPWPVKIMTMGEDV